MILKRAGDDFRRARAASVDQNHQGKPREGLALLGAQHRVLAPRAATRLRDCQVLVEEEVGKRDALIQQPARVSAQIQNHPGGTVRHQAFDGRLEFVAGVFAEHPQGNVPHAVLEQMAERHREDLNRGSLQRERNGLLDPRTPDPDVHLRARPAAQRHRRPVRVPALRGFALDLHDAIARADARPLPRGARQGAHHRDPVSLAHDLQPHAGVLAFGIDAEVVPFVGTQELRVGIVEFLYDGVDGGAVERIQLDRVHEVLGHPVEHLFQETRLEVDVAILRDALLEEPAATQQGRCQNKARSKQ